MLLSLIEVFCGGVCGVLARYGVNLALHTTSTPFPLGIFFINLSGCFTLGFLSQRLAVSAINPATQQHIRLFLGTGVLGGFTTYSALIVDTNLLLANKHPLLALTYPITSVGLGIVCAGLGVIAARATAKGSARRRREIPVTKHRVSGDGGAQ
ncbi:fluoride efflux transporter FluC [Arcanobacterium bovis]|uniref:fluoride efflux transporter FluC n=1 Tax=Arcanobacterium bovis TaxID=2529275 RepID=UPI0013F15C82|nr:CrcB family protein [Arcanobacterium bovis]